MLDIVRMEFQSLRNALADYFGDNSEILGPEDETYAWQSIVDACRDGKYPGLLHDTQELLKLSDEEIYDFFRFCAPAWKCDNPAAARADLDEFCGYVATYAK